MKINEITSHLYATASKREVLRQATKQDEKFKHIVDGMMKHHPR